MNKPASRGRKRKKRANVIAPLDEPSTSSSSLHRDEELPLPSCAQEEVTSPEEECLSQENKRSRVDGEAEENSIDSTTLTIDSSTVDSTTVSSEFLNIGEIRPGSEPINLESHTAENRLENEPITVESPTIIRSQEDVTIVGDVQVARPEVIDLERLPTIRQGGSVVVDLTNDSSFHGSNVVDLTRENPADRSIIDSSPMIVYVNRIYRGDAIRQLPSCRFARPGLPSRQLSDSDVEIQEVDKDASSEQNTGVDKPSTSSSEDPAPTTTTPYKKITCPICWDDEQIIKRRKRKLMSTTCGHVFCDQCIRSAVQMQNKCPTCRKKLTMRQLHPIFL